MGGDGEVHFVFIIMCKGSISDHPEFFFFDDIIEIGRVINIFVNRTNFLKRDRLKLQLFLLKGLSIPPAFKEK